MNPVVANASIVPVSEYGLDRYRYRLKKRSGCLQDYIGAFIAIEGIDGANIHARVASLFHTLKQLRDEDSGVAKPEVYATREPAPENTGFIIWQTIRRALPSEYRSPQIMTLLFAANRLAHLLGEKIENQETHCNGILRCLAKPGIVITGRYKYSSLAYQSLETPVSLDIGVAVVRPPDMEWIRMVNMYAPPPHVAVLIDVDPGVALRRIRMDRGGLHLYDDRGALARVRENFLRIFRGLEVHPEYSGELDPPWGDLVRSFARATPECVYPTPMGYPLVAVVEDGGRDNDEVVVEIVERVLKLLRTAGIIEFV